MLIPTILLFSFTSSNGTELMSQSPSDSLEIKKWTKEDFVNEYGFNDTAKALINLFLHKTKEEKLKQYLVVLF